MKEIDLSYNRTDPSTDPQSVDSPETTADMRSQPYSRLSKKQDRKLIGQVVMISAVTLVILFLIISYGIPLLFRLSSKLINLRPKTETQITSLEVAATPVLESSYLATPSATIKLSGTADPEASITIFQEDTELETLLADNDGRFTLDVNLNPGVNHFTALAINSSGKRSRRSPVIEITNITKAPKLEIEEPKDNQSFSNVDGINIKGQTDPNVSVYINNRSAIVDANGKFTYFYRLNGGETKLKFTAVDPAGNKTEKEITVTLSQ
jgi:hypothetical protein